MTRIIKAEEDAPAGVLNLADLAAEARSIVLEARQDAARIVADARTKADEITAAAQQKGYDEGFARGREEGCAEGRRQVLQEARATLAADLVGVADLARRLVAELDAHRTELLEQARQDLLEFAMELAGKVVGHAASGDLAPAREALEKALSEVQAQVHVTAKVNPRQLEALQAHAEAILGSTGLGLTVQFEADAEIEPGGVKLLTRHGLIDATIRTRLDNIAAALLGRV